MAAVACAALAVPMLGCGSGGSNSSGANLPPVNDYAQGGGARSSVPMQSAPRQGMSTGKKVVLLAGAAALYYLWRKHQANAANGSTAQNGQPVYYLSKNGQVYYRDQNARPHYVTPPTTPIQVPYNEAQQYPQLQQFSGYDGSTNGYTDLSRFAAQGGM